MTEEELAAELKKAHESNVAVAPAAASRAATAAVSPTLVAAWLFVGIPILWGAWITLQKALVLFK
jgi:hypothetical protein